jgi:hypothetical protein
MPSPPQPAEFRSLLNGVVALGCLATAIACTDSNSDDTVAADASAVPSLEACMTLSSVRAGTRFESDTAAFAIVLDQLEPEVPSLGDNSWLLTVRDAASQPVNDATLSFSLWMPEHAHGSLKTVLVQPLGHGQYRAEPLSFHMPGIWEITLRIDTDAQDNQLLFETCVTP